MARAAKPGHRPAPRSSPRDRRRTLYRVVIDPNDARKVSTFERHFYRQFGRLRDIVEGPDKALYILTSNHDGRGSPGPDDDRVIRWTFK
jgi:glucose/arabinose dehydrogenase